MATEFCEHLDQYGVQYTRTEACYQQCVSLLDQIMSGGPNPGLVGLVTNALRDWAEEDAKLRDMLVAEVQAGRVRVPLAVVRRRQVGPGQPQRKARHPGAPVCAECRFVVPRLEYPEWKIAHNGVASFKGQELQLPAAI